MADPDPFSNAWDRLVDGAVQAALKARERPEGAQALDKLTALLGTTAADVAADPSRGRTAIQAALSQAAAVLQDAASKDPNRRQAATAALSVLGDRLESVGLKPREGGPDAWIEAARERMASLPEEASRRIQELVHKDGSPPPDEPTNESGPANDRPT